MIKIIIVEDDVSWSKDYENIVNDELFKSEQEYEIHSFTKYTEELKKLILDNSEPKIYIMDLQVDKKHDGMDILREIRLKDWDSEIIVITNHDRMFETVHKEIYNIFDFIEKFNNYDKRLRRDIKKIISRKNDTGKFIFNSRKISLQIFLKDIQYIYRDTVDRKIVIKTTHNEFMLSMSILEILNKLDKRFIQCHKSCIINTDRIEKKDYSQGYFITDTGEKVSLLSKRYKEA